MRTFVLLFTVGLIGILCVGLYRHRRSTDVQPPSSPHGNVTTQQSDGLHSAASVRVGPPNAYPRKELTPGATDLIVTDGNIDDTICVPHYTQTVRPSSHITRNLKLRIMRTYNSTGVPADYELDHLIPLELGGCADCIENLWPERYYSAFGARDKDVVENYLHRAVCAHEMSLGEAQSEIVLDWVKVYKQIRPNYRGYDPN